jgi:hypothetical protein
MPLVDYASDSSTATSRSSTSESAQDVAAPAPAAKRRKVSAEADGVGHSLPTGANSGPSNSAMPPLPSAFYDLYASTVRQSNVDDPSLHQGRKRLIPHIAGNWPSHLYIECESAIPCKTTDQY